MTENAMNATNAIAGWLAIGLTVTSWYLDVGSAQAQPEAMIDESGGDLASRPTGGWHQGVSPADKQAARQLFEEAVALHEQLLFDQAVEVYAAALARWQHPRILLYSSKALAKLERLLAAHDHLRQALRWGPDALSQRDAALAARLEQQLTASLGQIEVRCDQPRARVSVNSAPWFSCGTTERRMARPGRYVITADKPGYHTVTRAVVVEAGKRAIVRFQMSYDEGTTLTRRWTAWKPWALAGAGLAVGTAGLVLRQRAGGQIARFDDAWRAACSSNPELGCLEGQQPGLIDDLESARWQHRIGVAALITGATAALAGFTLAALNPVTSHPDRSRGAADLEITPLLTPDSLGISTRLSF